MFQSCNHHGKTITQLESVYRSSTVSRLLSKDVFVDAKQNVVLICNKETLVGYDVIRSNLNNAVANEGMRTGTKLEAENNLEAPRNLYLGCSTCTIIVDLIPNFIKKFSMQRAQHLKQGCQNLPQKKS